MDFDNPKLASVIGNRKTGPRFTCLNVVIIVHSCLLAYCSNSSWENTSKYNYSDSVVEGVNPSQGSGNSKLDYTISITNHIPGCKGWKKFSCHSNSKNSEQSDNIGLSALSILTQRLTDTYGVNFNLLTPLAKTYDNFNMKLLIYSFAITWLGRLYL